MPLTYQKNETEQTITITGFSGRIRDLKIPDRIEHLPVAGIAGHAFSERKDLKRVVLPDSMRVLGPFAFYSCPNLEEIVLCDEIEDYYDGVIKNCRNLSEITVKMCRENYDLIRRLLSDNDRKLRFLLIWDAGGEQDRRMARLTFPEYVYDYREDTHARAFHLKIEGGGYKYRECVSRRGIDFKTYDSYFYWATVDDTAAAAEIAFGRLLYPEALSEKAKRQYEKFLQEHALEVVQLLVRRKKMEELSYMTGHELIPESSLPEAIRTASEERQPEFCGMLMDYQQKHVQKKDVTGGFSLEDW